ncbi:MAG: major capsid protein [Microviridae sp.]|nr:MAG: major capsid protein [Microviridae sp.]
MAKQYLFNSVPTIHRRRTPFNLSHKVFTSMNVGDLVPILCQEVYPGDDFKIDSAYIARTLSEYIRPVMDSLYMDIAYFFVPNRLILNTFKNVMGESNGAWAPSQTYTIPDLMDWSGRMNGVNNEVFPGTVADYLGIPPRKYPVVSQEALADLPKVSVLPFRAFALVYDTWWRDENVEPPMSIRTDTSFVGVECFNNQEWSPTNYTGKLPKVSKFHDYFTSALPSPQKGSAVSLPIGSFAPVVTGDNHSVNSSVPVHFVSRGSSSPVGNLYLDSSGELKATDSSVADTGLFATPSNLVADLSEATAATINDQRVAWQTQRLLERDARGGTRFIEYIRSAFGVDAGDYRLNRPEFLGGKRIPLSVQQVPQTVNNDADKEFVGSLGAYSLSFGSARARKGFVEHGFIIGVAVIRQKHTYQQGIEKYWSRLQRTDFYDPVFQNLGEQPIKATEIFAGAKRDTVFGYQEAWADLRQRPNRVSGAMRSHGETADLDIWHFADDFATAPVLNRAFMKETEENVNRALRVPHTTEYTPQFIVEFDIKMPAVRVLPGQSEPGLVDHH